MPSRKETSHDTSTIAPTLTTIAMAYCCKPDPPIDPPTTALTHALTSTPTPTSTTTIAMAHGCKPDPPADPPTKSLARTIPTPIYDMAMSYSCKPDPPVYGCKPDPPNDPLAQNNIITKAAVAAAAATTTTTERIDTISKNELPNNAIILKSHSRYFPTGCMTNEYRNYRKTFPRIIIPTDELKDRFYIPFMKLYPNQFPNQSMEQLCDIFYEEKNDTAINDGKTYRQLTESERDIYVQLDIKNNGKKKPKSKKLISKKYNNAFDLIQQIRINIQSSNHVLKPTIETMLNDIEMRILYNNEIINDERTNYEIVSFIRIMYTTVFNVSIQQIKKRKLDCCIDEPSMNHSIDGNGNISMNNTVNDTAAEMDTIPLDFENESMSDDEVYCDPIEEDVVVEQRYTTYDKCTITEPFQSCHVETGSIINDDSTMNDSDEFVTPMNRPTTLMALDSSATGLAQLQSPNDPLELVSYATTTCFDTDTEYDTNNIDDVTIRHDCQTILHQHQQQQREHEYYYENQIKTDVEYQPKLVVMMNNIKITKISNTLYDDVDNIAYNNFDDYFDAM